MVDPEIEAMAKCHEQLNPLDSSTKTRVIQWLISKYELGPHASLGGVASTNNEKQPKPEVRILSNGYEDDVGEETLVAVPQSKSQQENTIESFETVAEFFAATSPRFEWEKALVVAAYLQVKNGLSDFNSLSVNKELKNLGHGIAEISRAFQVCIDKKPQLILQLRKEGKTKQAQKKYKVSAEGIKVVKNMINA